MQPSLNPNPGVNMMDALVKDKKAYHELLVRNGYVLPDIDSKFVSSDNLISIQAKKLYGLKVADVVIR
jgi:hypothetical protein